MRAAVCVDVEGMLFQGTMWADRGRHTGDMAVLPAKPNHHISSWFCIAGFLLLLIQFEIWIWLLSIQELRMDQISWGLLMNGEDGLYATVRTGCRFNQLILPRCMCQLLK